MYIWYQRRPWVDEDMNECTRSCSSINDTLSDPICCLSPNIWYMNATHLCPPVDIDINYCMDIGKFSKFDSQLEYMTMSSQRI